MDKASLGFYFETIRVIERLHRAQADSWIIHPQYEELGILYLVDKLGRMLRSLSPDGRNVRFRPFPRVIDFHDSFEQFGNKLANHVDENDANAGGGRLGVTLSRELRRLVDLLRETVQDEVERQWVFVPTLQNRQYDSPDLFLTGEQDRNIYNRLPRITRQQLEDAGKCLTYGMPGASSGMALQAVESALRYYYRRHSNRTETMWNEMLRELKRDMKLPGQDDTCFQRLNRIRTEYRNAVAHGRAMYEEHKGEKSLATSERTFAECWNAIRELYSQSAQRQHLGLRIEISAKLNFDCLLATYLFYWNPELPDITANTFLFRTDMASDRLIDSTALDVGQRIWAADINSSLSQQVMNKLQIQRSFADTIKVLTDFGQKCFEERRVAQTGVNTPLEQDADLFDVLEGVRLTNKNEHAILLENAWKVFDQFLDTELPPTDSSLLLVSNFKGYFDELRKH